MAYGAGAAWVGNWHDNSVFRIDPATNRVVGSPIPTGSHHGGNLAVGAGGVWVTSDYRANAAAEDVVVVRIDPETNRAVETITVGGHPIDVAASRSDLGVGRRPWHGATNCQALAQNFPFQPGAAARAHEGLGSGGSLDACARSSATRRRPR